MGIRQIVSSIGNGSLAQVMTMGIPFNCINSNDDCGYYEIELLPGEYFFEVWGASGGTSSYLNHTGGRGGYSNMTMAIHQKKTIFAFIGGEGLSNNISNAVGGYNGGGNGMIGSNCLYHGGGGGSTDFRFNISTYSRFLVAGGGGGGGHYITMGPIQGGNGGGDYGQDGQISYVFNTCGYGGTPTSGGNGSQSSQPGNFGMGGSGYGAQNSGGGGGGGYYGGGGGHVAGGGGGSGFVLSNGWSVDGDHYFPSPDGGVEIGHIGNGYAKISQISSIHFSNIYLSNDICSTHFESPSIIIGLILFFYNIVL